MPKPTIARVLIVEDERSIAEMYRLKLTLSGFLVRVAHNGIAGLAEAKEFAPDLILLDLKMPLMGGDEMLQELRSYDWGKNIRVIVLTNISRSEAPQSLWVLAVDRYIVKAHTTPSQVVHTISEIV